MKKIAGSVLLVIIATGLSVLINVLLAGNQKVGWISLPEVFNKFEYKTELEKKFTKSEEARKKIIDSMEFNLKVSYSTIQAAGNITDEVRARFEVQRENYVQKKASLEEDNSKMRAELNNQILTQLNQYVQEFGKENDYKVILGAEGNGSLMYGNEADNISKEVLEYINAKYKGQVK